MTAEQLLEQMEIFEKAKNDFDEFEKSHHSAFKSFLNSFGFSNDEINQIISGNINISTEKEDPNGEISAKNKIIELFKIFNEITELQKEKIQLIIQNDDDAKVENSKTIHFENLANAINEVPMDYYRKVKDEKANDDNTNKNDESTNASQTVNQPNQEQVKVQNDNQKPQNAMEKPQPVKEPQQGQQKINTHKIDIVTKADNSNSGQKIVNNIQFTPGQKSNNNSKQKTNNNAGQRQNRPNQNININTNQYNQGPRQGNQGKKPNYNTNQRPNSHPAPRPPPQQPQQQQQQQQQQQRYTPKYAPPSNQGTSNAPVVQKRNQNQGTGITIQKKTSTGGSIFDKK